MLSAASKREAGKWVQHKGQGWTGQNTRHLSLPNRNISRRWKIRIGSILVWGMVRREHPERAWHRRGQLCLRCWQPPAGSKPPGNLQMLKARSTPQRAEFETGLAFVTLASDSGATDWIRGKEGWKETWEKRQDFSKWDLEFKGELKSQENRHLVKKYNIINI